MPKITYVEALPVEVTEEQPLQMESTKEVNVMRTKKKKEREKERVRRKKEINEHKEVHHGH